MRSPFKFLDAFTLKDKDAFFGRDQEIDTLYTVVFKTPMLLVYGLSGTGKTSLIQCGLANRFDGPDWYPIFIRRNSNINTSANAALHTALGNTATNNLTENVSLLLRKTLRPVYLLFDQFEELFILGKEEEQKLFMQSLRELLDAQLPSKIVLIMREEYIGQLYNYEELIPELFDHRFRVEPMGPAKVKKVIQSSFEKFNIQLAEPKEELLEAMVQNISDPRTGITLPYLQVYLDMLYRDKYRKQYGQTEQQGYPKIEITKNEINQMGKIDNVLERFLEDQTRELRVELVRKYKIVKPDVIQSVLDVFVSEEGTKRPVTFKQTGDAITLTDDAAAVAVKDIPANILTDIVQALHTDRILRRSDENFELAHDSLALVIDSRRSESQRQLQNVRKRLANAFEEYQKTGAFLNQKQLASFEEYLPQLGLSKEMTQFLDKCDKEVVRQASEEKDRLQQENRMAQQKKLARTRGFLLSIAVVLAAIAGFMAFQSHQKAGELQLKSDLLEKEKASSNQQRDSIANILIQVDQQFSMMDSIVSGKKPYNELVKTVITLKSLVRNDTMEASEMAAQYISVINLFTTSNLDQGPEKSQPDSVFQTARVNVALHLNTPQPKEYIQVKWMTVSGKIIGDPYYVEVSSGPDHTKWVSASTMIKDTGNFRVEVYNSLGIEVGRKNFRIKQAVIKEARMDEDSRFFTYGNKPTIEGGRNEKTTFKVGEVVWYWFRINSVTSETIYVKLIDEKEESVWQDDKNKFNLGVGAGFRGFNGHSIKKPGKYVLRLVNGKGTILGSSKPITVE